MGRSQQRNAGGLARRALGLFFAGWILTGPLAHANSPETDAGELLPPVGAWSGASESFVAPPDHPWITPAERGGLARTPSYEETFAWLRRLADADGRLRLVSAGRSWEGREIWMAVVSAEGVDTPQGLERGRPTLLVQAGIHSGEIDGKDAGLMLLRDLLARPAIPAAESPADVLERVNLLFIPILNPDGHERSSRFGRINQRGPVDTGWRTNARNQNLNRDYAKADSPEIRALLGVLREWSPDLYVDVHVTDGIDYQYDVTFGFNGSHAWSPAIAGWLEATLRPRVDEDLRRAGHVPGPLLFAVNGLDLRDGHWDWTASPRYSNGYGDARHLPTVLVENHSLKPYRRRVLGTRVLLESLLRLLANEGGALRAAVRRDRNRRLDPVPLDWRSSEGEPPVVELLGIRSFRELSEISGAPVVRWTGEPVTIASTVLRSTEPASTVSRPDAYWIPPAWPEVVERLQAHGVQLERIETAREIEVEVYRLESVELGSRPYEGRVRVEAEPRPERRRVRFAAGSVRVPTDQPLGNLTVLLLEPESPESFFRWGFFLEVLQRTEYAESYVMEPLARHMLERDPDLAEAFRTALLNNEALASDPRARLEWFYRRTPYYDDRWRVYPIARETD